MQIRQQGNKVQLIKLKDAEAKSTKTTETTEKKARKSSEVVLSIDTGFWEIEIEQILTGNREINLEEIRGLDRIEYSEKLTDTEKKVAAKELKSIFIAKIEAERIKILAGSESRVFFEKINAAVQVEMEKGANGSKYRIMTLLGHLRESVKITEKARTIIVNAQNSD